ncbi:DUF4433 domain-containing protein [Pseudopedobacter beijingensis]|uniref:DUF4433 domain-containing protein n=1 Tax=Pseudopedobacter beijingensis TaxID=1207056 RepID=A0ABW4I976_9SPHI
MPHQKLDKIWLYRILHINNMEYTLKNGLYHKNHEKADPGYINIGDQTLIQQRNDYPVDINPPNGLLGEYIPFYFGPLSPMLYNIYTGYRGVTRRPQQDIVYICCNLKDITDCCNEWCFTDGHAKNAITTFYNNLEHINLIDLDLAKQRYWNNTDDDFDRMRKKQAEFMVKYHIPANCIRNIVVYDKKAAEKIRNLVENLELEIEVHINPSGRFYY